MAEAEDPTMNITCSGGIELPPLADLLRSLGMDDKPDDKDAEDVERA